MYTTSMMSFTPMESWTLIGALFLATLLFVLIIEVAVIAPGNIREVGLLKGIWYALGGVEIFSIQQERVIEVTRNAAGYTATTFDGEENVKYLVVVSNEDIDEKAMKRAKGDKELAKLYLPESHVRARYVGTNDNTGDIEFVLFVCYLRYNSPAEVEKALNNYFEKECDLIANQYEELA